MNLANRGRNWGVFVFTVCTVLLLATFASTAHAQRFDATLRGEVIDASGASVPDAKVTATNEGTGVSQATTTTSAGTYVFPNLLPGSYRLTVERKGFKKYDRPNIQVSSNQTTEASAQLELGSEETTIEVTGGADLVQTNNSTLTNTFESQLVTELPNNGGTPLQLALLSPGITSNGSGVQGDGGSVGGIRPRANGFTIDGADDNDVTVTGRVTPVIPDAVGDLTIITNQFSAEYGHSAAGLYNMTTKTGTNDTHGQVHWFTQNRNFNAVDNLIGAQLKAHLIGNKPRFDHNDLGASLGGPLVTDKLFFFGAYDFTNQGQFANGPTNTPPTGAGLAALNAIAAAQGFTQVGNILAQMPKAPAQTSSQPVTDTGGALGPKGGIIQIPVGDIQTFASTFTNEHDFQTNVDYNEGRHQIRGRFMYSRQRNPFLNLTTPLPQFNGFVKGGNRRIVLGDAWAVSSRFINDFRVSYSRQTADFATPPIFSNFPTAEVDALNLSVGPNVNLPQGRTTNVYQILDNQTFNRGRHTFKWGGEYIKWIAPSFALPRARGEWDYANLNTLVNDLVPDGANGALRGAGDGGFNNSQKAGYFFFQDDWKIFRRLTLNLGLRYEVSTFAASAQSQKLNAIANCPPTECKDPNSPLGLIFGVPKTDTNNLSPRFGFAYDPTGSGKWAIRGGAQVAFDVSFSNVLSNNLPPELQTEQNPTITCGAVPPPAWCATGVGFLQGGGLLSFNLPPTTQIDARNATSSLMVDQVQPKVITWSLSVQHELFKNTSLELRYVGTRGISLPVQIRRNQQPARRVDPNLQNLPVFFDGNVPATITPSAEGTLAAWRAASGIQVFGAQNFFGNITAFDPKGQSTYHGISADLIHRYSHGLSMRYNFTWSHTLDNSTNEFFTSFVNPRRPQDTYNIPNERGNSVIDIPLKSALSIVYELPKVGTSSPFGQHILNGWELSGTWLAQSGQPITPQGGTDLVGTGSTTGARALINPLAKGLSGTGTNYVCNAGAGGATSVVSAVGGACGASNIVGYVPKDLTARYIGQHLLGASLKTQAGRNSIGTPGFNVVDMSIIKNIYVKEQAHFQFRTEMYNAFNHRNLSLNIPTVLTVNDTQNAQTTAYALVTSSNFLNPHAFSGGNRIIQLGLKYIW